MQWFSLVTLLCASNLEPDIHRPDCFAHFKECVEVIYANPDVRSKGYTEEAIAKIIILDPEFRSKNCK